MTGCRIGKVTLKEATEVTRDELLSDGYILDEAADVLRDYGFRHEAFAVEQVAFALKANALAHVAMSGVH